MLWVHASRDSGFRGVSLCEQCEYLGKVDDAQQRRHVDADDHLTDLFLHDFECRLKCPLTCSIYMRQAHREIVIVMGMMSHSCFCFAQSRNSSDMTSDASQVVQRHRASKDMLARPMTASYRDRSPPRHTSSGSNAWNDIQTEHVGGGRNNEIKVKVTA
jgi:hypothetical protein